MLFVNGYKPEFVYPDGKQFLFDKVANEIVRAIAKRNWEVPGLKVEFDFDGSGEGKKAFVSRISGENFRLCFSTWRGHCERAWRFDHAVCEISIPRQSIRVFSNEEGPYYYRYVGVNWDEDKEQFMDGEKWHAKEKGEPRTYLVYAGSHPPRQEYMRPETLLAFDDGGCEYKARVDEPRKFNVRETLLLFKVWLESQVLKYIEMFPEAEVQGDPPIESDPPIPYSGPWDAIYAFGRGEVDKKLDLAKKDINLIHPEDRYAIAPGMRLISCAYEDYRIPRRLYDGFVWGYLKPDIPEDLWDHMTYSTVAYGRIVTIKPLYANDIYVVDNAPYRNTKNAKNGKLDETEECMARYLRAATIVPLSEYKGQFEEPVVLFEREILLDEVVHTEEVRD